MHANVNKQQTHCTDWNVKIENMTSALQLKAPLPLHCLGGYYYLTFACVIFGDTSCCNIYQLSIRIRRVVHESVLQSGTSHIKHLYSGTSLNVGWVINLRQLQHNDKLKQITLQLRLFIHDVKSDLSHKRSFLHLASSLGPATTSQSNLFPPYQGYTTHSQGTNNTLLTSYSARQKLMHD